MMTKARSRWHFRLYSRCHITVIINILLTNVITATFNRVLNVIRQWLEYHWYDFDREEKNAPTTTVAATFTPTTPAETTPPPPTVAPDAPITPAVNAPVVTTNGESPEPQPPTTIDTIEQSPPAVAAEATPAVGPEPPATNKPPEEQQSRKKTNKEKHEKSIWMMEHESDRQVDLLSRVNIFVGE